MDAATATFVKSLTSLTPEQSLIYKSAISRLLEIDEQSDETYKFPGAEPVTLEKTGLSQIISEDFLVCEKTDGTRFLFYVDLSDMTVPPDVCEQLDSKKNVFVGYFAYFIDREYNFLEIRCDINLSALEHYYKVNTKNYSPTMFSFFSAIFDGEIVADKADDSKDTKEFKISFYLFDTLYFGRSFMSDFLGKRLEKCKLCAEKKFVLCSGIGIHTKLFVDKREINEILQQQKQLRHESDGLIFTKVKAGYSPGTTQNIEKWKPISENSVDVHVEVGTEIVLLDGKQITLSEVKLYVANRGILESSPITPGGVMYLQEKSFEAMAQRQKSCNPLILEVYWDAEKEVTDYAQLGVEGNLRAVEKITRKGGWSSIKFRVDKRLPNDRRVFDSVMRAYDEFIDIDEIQRIIAGDEGIPGVCTAPSPFVLRKMGEIRAQQVDEEYAV